MGQGWGRVRWGRVAGVMLAGPVLAWGAGLAALWATASTPVPGERTSGAEACVVSDVLDWGRGVADDGLVADIVVQAAQCRTLGSVEDEALFEVFRTIDRALPAIRTRSAPDEALDGLLDVWALAVDQQNDGSLFHLAVWTGLALKVAPEVGRLLTDPALTVDARGDATRRLRELAGSEVDWVRLRPHEERATWKALRRALAHPREGGDLVPLAPHYVWVARQGTHPIVAEFREDEVALRSQARLLAALAEDPV